MPGRYNSIAFLANFWYKGAVEQAIFLFELILHRPFELDATGSASDTNSNPCTSHKKGQGIEFCMCHIIGSKFLLYITD